jgi:hypothetical protein
VLHYHRLELDEAIASGERAMALDPNFAGAHFGIAEASLLRGDFARGWEKYEWRMKLANAPPLLPPTERPQWDGSPMPDGTLLLIADCGYGDVIQFARYIPWAAARCAQLAIACSAELHPVIAQQAGGAPLFDHWERVPQFTRYCPLSGLPRLAGTSLDTIPGRIPYVRADPARSALWAERLGALVLAAIAASGSPGPAGRPITTTTTARPRSPPLRRSQIPDRPRPSLQKGPAQAQIGGYWGRAPLVNWGRDRDFGDTVAVVGCLEGSSRWIPRSPIWRAPWATRPG